MKGVWGLVFDKTLVPLTGASQSGQTGNVWGPVEPSATRRKLQYSSALRQNQKTTTRLSKKLKGLQAQRPYGCTASRV